MPRHRARSRRHHTLSSLTVTGAALGVSLLSPFTAVAAPGASTLPVQPTRSGNGASGGGRCDDVVADPGATDDEVHEALADARPGEVVCVSVDADDDAGPDTHSHRHAREAAYRHGHGGGRHRAARPMTSGERQQRIGCLQGYIVDDCERFSVENLLRRGIDPSQ